MDEKDNQDLAYLIVGGVVAVAVIRFWSTTAKPWLLDLVPALKDEGHVAIGSFEVATSDFVAVAVILVLLLIGGLTVRSWLRAKKKAKKQEQASV